MKPLLFLPAALLLLVTATTHGKELAKLDVLYVGSERASEYVDFLTSHVARVEAKSRSDFQLADAESFDVVLLDWPQGEETREMRKLTSPLGARDEWNKPTVLLGSAGLNLAVAWKLKGGSGCTCLDPLAYDLREHEIFDRLNKIDRSQMISIPTPPDFQAKIEHEEIQVLPLVDDRDRTWPAGWCSYSNDFTQNPDVEFFCGGVNHKTPTAAGLWRQGNLLHFGFEQSPAEMNEMGQRLLLNAIAYISRFTEDRPIAVTPSVFAGPVARSRSTLARWLRNPNYQLDWVKSLVAPQLWEQLSALSDRETMAEWAEENARFLHPNEAQQLQIDADLVALDVSFDKPEFFEKTLSSLGSDDMATVARARRLLERYVPAGPKDGDADAWLAWWNENRPYAFASDAGDYCWYVDPLAKQRGIPSSKLRGASRATPDTASPASSARTKAPALRPDGNVLDAVDRSIAKEPQYASSPKYALLVLGTNAESKVWIVEDGETLYVDKNGNGNLTDDGPPLMPTNVRELGASPDGASRRDFDYLLDEIAPADGSRHMDFRLVRWNYGSKKDGYGISIILNGQTPMYAGWTSFWAASPDEAPLIHFGGLLQPRMLRFKEFVVNSKSRRLSVAFVNPGRGEGAQSRLSIDALPQTVIPVVQIDWPVAGGTPSLRTSYPLKERCCYWEFYDPEFKIPEAAVPGTATVKISFFGGLFLLPLTTDQIEVPVRAQQSEPPVQ